MAGKANETRNQTTAQTFIRPGQEWKDVSGNVINALPAADHPRPIFQSEIQSLKQSLEQLKNHYRVDIVFFDRIVEGCSVPADALNVNRSVETNLTTLLKPFGLTFKRTKNGGYIVTGNGRNQKKTGGSPLINNGQRAASKPPLTNGSADRPTESIRNEEPAQLADIVITGTVRDGEKDEVLPGVCADIKGTTRGTTTDSDGNSAG